MSHLHLPDGLFPAWLVLAGWAVALGLLALACGYAGRSTALRRRVPRVAIAAAFMLVAMSLEIVPLAYHFNLSIIAGALLGCLLSPVAAVVVIAFLALMGHGGVTLIGLNTVMLSFELCAGSLLFHGLRWLLRTQNTASGQCETSAWRTGLAGALTVAVVLPATAALTLCVSSLGLPLGTLPQTVAILGPVGWAAEAALTGLTLAYVERIRPSLLDGFTWRARRRQQEAAKHSTGQAKNSQEATEQQQQIRGQTRSQTRGGRAT
jgi:ABC-type Co2+ transport system permease subunit